MVPLALPLPLQPELASFKPAHESKAYVMKEIDWIARILWASLKRD